MQLDLKMADGCVESASVSALTPLKGEQCARHKEVLSICIAILHSEYSAREDVCVCVRQTHVFVCV